MYFPHAAPSRAHVTRASILSLALLGAGLLLSTACTGTILSEEEEDKLSIAVETRWAIPADILSIGDTQEVAYTGAGPWNGSSSCSGGMLDGTRELKDFIEASFPQVSSIGGYACRSIVGNSSRMSVHGTGRALDVHIPLRNGRPDNEAGDVIGNWLIANAEAIGIQYIIWDRTQWTANRPAGTKERRYNGAHPHNDHLHIELSPAGGAKTTSWFGGQQTPPTTPSCESIAAQGSVLDNTSLCLELHGASQYWRSVEGAGHGGELLWTNAFQSASPSNWARYELSFEAAGRYDVQVFLDPEFAEFAATEYRVQHAGGNTSLTIDQSLGQGWLSLGAFDFALGGSQSLSVYDNVSTAPGAERMIMVDAVRLVPQP